MDSPSNSSVLRFWEEPVCDFTLDYPSNDYPSKEPSSSSAHLNPPPFSSSCSSFDTSEFGRLENLSNDRLLMELDGKLALGQDGCTSANPSQSKDKLVIREEPPKTLNSDNMEGSNLSSYGMGRDELNCIACILLREVTHTDGTGLSAKLEIHGTIGMIDHAIMEVSLCNADTEGPTTLERRFVDLSMHNFDQVKQYLLEYGEARARQGFTVTSDSLNAFLECLCTGMSGTHNAMGPTEWGPHAAPLNAASTPVQPIKQPGSWQEALNIDPGESSIGIPKSSIAAQRARTGKLKLKDLTDYFHLPIQVASKKLAVCSTVLKKICRRNGLKRWPYRKIKSIDRNITSLQQSLAASSGQEKASIFADIERLQQQRAQICAGIAVED